MQKQIKTLQAKAQKTADQLNQETVIVTQGKQHIQVQAGIAYQLNTKDANLKNTNLIAKKVGNNLEVSLEDSVVIFDNYFEVCSTDLSCLVSLPTEDGGLYHVVAETFFTLEDGTQIVYFYGEQSIVSTESSETKAKESSEVNTSNSQNSFDAITSNMGIVAGVAVAAAVIAGGSGGGNDDNGNTSTTVKLSYSTTSVSEPSTNDGSIATSIIITLSNDTFVGVNGSKMDNKHYTASNVPAGLTMVITKISDTIATVTLTGTATAHANANNINNLGITFKADAFTTTTAADIAKVIGYAKTDLAIDFTEPENTTPPALNYSTTSFSESNTNDGSIATSIIITLSNDTFVGANGSEMNSEYYTTSNVPAGLTMVIAKTSNTTATVTFTGKATAHANVNDINNLGITFKADAFTTTTTADITKVTNYAKTDLAIDFIDAPDNTVPTLVSATVDGATLVLTYNEALNATNAPEINTFSLKVNGVAVSNAFIGNVVVNAIAKTVVLTLANAIANDDIMLVSYAAPTAAGDIKAIQDRASNNAASIIDQVVTNTTVSLSYNTTSFFESNTNDGSIATSIIITLSNDTFVGANGSEMNSEYYTASNVPAGLTMLITKTSNTTATVTFTGKATAHANANDINNLGITFKVDAFTATNVASKVTIHSKTDFAINFIDVSDNTAPTVTGATNPSNAEVTKAGETLSIELTLSETAILTNNETATIVLLIDKTDGSGTQEVTATATGNGNGNGTASNKLTFTTATLPNNLTDNNGVEIKTNSLAFTEAMFKDAAGNEVSKTFTQVDAIGNKQVDTHAPTDVDLDPATDVQSTSKTLLTRSEITAGAAFDDDIADTTDTDIKTIKVVFGADFDGAHDNLILDTEIALNSDIAKVTGKIIGTITGLEYTYSQSSQTLIISKTSGVFIVGDVAKVVEAIKLKNTDTDSQLDTRTAAITYINIAGNESVSATASLSVTSYRGFVINGEAAGDESGRSVSSAGDVNGDGLDDLIVGARGADGNKGKSYVIFSKKDTSAIDLSVIASGTGGFVINGEVAYDQSGYSVSNAGDVNGDGLNDLIVGAFGANSRKGKSYVVFGKKDTTAIDLSAITSGTGGFVINGESETDNSGISVSNAGDVNGDGLDDLIVGAEWADPENKEKAGKSYVVFGKKDTAAIDLSAIVAGTSTGGFVVNGESTLDYSGFSVSNAGDVNGDGLNDLIVGAFDADGLSGKS